MTKPVYPNVFKLCNDCRHLGEMLDDLGCNCPHRWVYECPIHETTSKDQCTNCPDYEPHAGLEGEADP
jgi:hypothetical protein